jgi:DNA-binding transcriptional LysR family regulator
MELPRLLDGRLKLRHLVLVDALTEHGSIVAAAAHLRITQPGLTRTLHELEDMLGVTLYERGPRGVTPTLYGTAFTAHARAVLAQITQAGQHIAELADARRGTVRVGTHLAGSNLLLPRTVARFKASRPNVTVVIREATPDVLLTELEAGRIDLIVGRLTGLPDPGMTVRRTLYNEPVRLVTRRQHPARLLAEPKLKDLAGFPWILPGDGTALRGELEQVFLRHELPLPANRIECTSILTVRTLLVETDVIAALPLLIAEEDSRTVVLPVSLEPMSHTVGVTVSANRPASPAVDALLAEFDAVAAEMRQQLYPDGMAYGELGIGQAWRTRRTITS